MKTHLDIIKEIYSDRKNGDALTALGQKSMDKLCATVEELPLDVESSLHISIMMTASGGSPIQLSKQFFAVLFDLAYQKQRADHFEALCKSKDIIDDVITRAQTK